MSEEVVLSATTKHTHSTGTNISLLKSGPFLVSIGGILCTIGTVIAAISTVIVLILVMTPFPPIPGDDWYMTYKNLEYKLDVLKNDYDERNNTLSIVDIIAEPHIIGHLSIKDGYISYMSGSLNGLITFNYVVSNGRLNNTGIVTIEQMNLEPEAKNIHVTIIKGTKYHIIDVSEYVSDRDNDTLSIAGRNDLYLPVEHPYHGQVIKYGVTDGVDTVYAHIYINMINTPPIARNDRWHLSRHHMYHLHPLDNDEDSSDPITLVDVFNICSYANIFKLDNNTIEWIPSQDLGLTRIGCAFQYTITDGEFLSTANGHITVGNNVPTIEGNTFFVPKMSNITVKLNVSDIDIFDDITILSEYVHRNEIGREVIRYMNDTDIRELITYEYILSYQTGTQDISIQLTVTDGIDQNMGTIKLSIINDIPTCTNISTICMIDTTCMWNVIDMCIDSDNDTLTLISQYKVGSMIGYTPSMVGIHYIPYSVSDPMDVSDTYYVIVNVTSPIPDNQSPQCGTNATVHVMRVPHMVPEYVSLLDMLQIRDPEGDIIYIILPDDSITQDKYVIPNLLPGSYDINVIPSDGTYGMACTLTLIIGNRDPICRHDTYMLGKDVVDRIHPISVNAIDPDMDVIHVMNVTGHTGVTYSGTEVYIPIDAEYTGTINIDIIIGDPYDGTCTYKVTIYIDYIGPEAVDDHIIVDQQSMAYITSDDILSNDKNYHMNTIESIDCDCHNCCNPDVGSKPELLNNRYIIFNPSRDRCGTMIFGYTITDGIVTSNGTVTVKMKNCMCSKRVDMVFMIDGSSSISVTQWKDMRLFISMLVSKLTIGVDHVMVGIVQYGTTVYIDGNSGITLSGDNIGVRNRIDSLVQVGGYTNTRHALYAATEMVRIHGRSDVETVYILITDGDSYGPRNCDECDAIKSPMIDGKEYCTMKMREFTGVNQITCAYCSSFPRACSNPIEQGNIINGIIGTKLIAMGIGDSISSVGKQDLMNLNNDGSLIHVPWDQLNSIHSHIIDISCT